MCVCVCVCVCVFVCVCVCKIHKEVKLKGTMIVRTTPAHHGAFLKSTCYNAYHIHLYAIIMLILIACHKVHGAGGYCVVIFSWDENLYIIITTINLDAGSH